MTPKYYLIQIGAAIKPNLHRPGHGMQADHPGRAVLAPVAPSSGSRARRRVRSCSSIHMPSSRSGVAPEGDITRRAGLTTSKRTSARLFNRVI